MFDYCNIFLKECLGDTLFFAGVTINRGEKNRTCKELYLCFFRGWKKVNNIAVIAVEIGNSKK